MIKRFESFASNTDGCRQSFLLLSDIFQNLEDDFDGRVRYFTSDYSFKFTPISKFNPIAIKEYISIEFSLDYFQRGGFTSSSIIDILKKMGFTHKQIVQFSTFNIQETIKKRVNMIKQLGIDKNEFFNSVSSISRYDLFDFQVDYENLKYFDITFCYNF